MFVTISKTATHHKKLFMLMRWLLDPHLRMGVMGRGVNHGIRGLELSVVPLPYLWEGIEAGN